MGAYRLATELRRQNYNVLVLDFFGRWIQDRKSFDALLKSVISDETVFVGYSGTFFSTNTTVSSTINEYNDFYRHDTISTWPCDVNYIKLLNLRIKSLNPDIKIFYGGAWASFLTSNLSPKFTGVDYIVQGFADSYIVDLVHRLQEKKHIPYSFENDCKVIKYDVTGQKFNFSDQGQTIYHESDCFSASEVLPLETSRGCMFKCKFCSFPLLGRKKNDNSYHKSPTVVAQELEHNYKMFGVTGYMFVDDTFNETTDKIKEIHDAIKQSGVDIKFACYLRLDLIERYPEQIQLLKDMGVQSVFLGVETLNPRSARAVGKNSDPESVKQTLELMREILGDQCSIYASFIVGLPHETEETFNQWMSWVYDREDLIDSLRMNALTLNGQDASWPSEISKNPEKFGYTFDQNNNWINNVGMTEQTAQRLSNEWLKKGFETGRIKIGGFDIMGLQNMGFSFDELKNLEMRSLPIKTLRDCYQQMFNDYKQRLLAYLNK